MRSEAERLEWIARCERIQTRLLAALGAVEQTINPEDVAQIREWIAVNENGLALERLLIAAAEAGLTLDTGIGERLDFASAEMGGDAGLWRLPPAALASRLKENGFT